MSKRKTLDDKIMDYAREVSPAEFDAWTLYWNIEEPDNGER